MSTLVQEMMKRDGLTKQEVIETIMEEFEECGMDHEATLEMLGFEPDYVFELFDILANY